MSDFVKPEVVRLPLSGSQFIDVRKRLSHGEREDMLAARLSRTADGLTVIDHKSARTLKVLAYLIGWSLTDEGAPVPISPHIPSDERTATLRSLSMERFDEIFQAINDHEEGAVKKILDGENESSAISPSLESMAGAMSGSEN